jgi:DNA polymerase-1
MTKPPVLIIDVSAVAYTAFHTLGDLSFDGVATGVVMGLLRTIKDLQELYSTNRVAFCFDRGSDNRQAMSSVYKQNRHSDMDEEERLAYRNLSNQLFKLRTKYLPMAGFKNLFWQDGYEADDVIASVCLNLPLGELGIIVSSDADLFQLLVDNRVIMWHLKRKAPVTAELFRKSWGIDPFLWSDVKAIAGCSGDNVIGVRGVGEKTAVKFLTGMLKETSKAHQAIVLNNATYRDNLRLVRLPFAGTKKFEVMDDEVNGTRWDRLCDLLGLKTLRGRFVGYS